MGSKTQAELLVDDVVSALTDPPEGQTHAGSDLRAQMERAAEDVDRRTAMAFAGALVDSLCDDPGNTRRLEALLILGLAHPAIVKRYKISLAAEGRRLAVLLENSGETDRARGLLELLLKNEPESREVERDLSSLMRREGNLDELVERLMRNAEEQVEAGRPQDAIAWLQEILLHDPSRRDVARMIRDIRYAEVDERKRVSRRNRVAVLLVLVSALLTGFVVREVKVQRAVDALPPAATDDLASVRQRMAGIDDLVETHKAWIGMFPLLEERNRMRERADTLEAQVAQKQREESRRAEERRTIADAARIHGVEAVEGGNYSQALAHFRRALEFGSPTWEHRDRTSADIAALEAWLEENR